MNNYQGHSPKIMKYYWEISKIKKFSRKLRNFKENEKF